MSAETSTPRYIGLWDGGGGNYASSYWADHALAFNDLEHAKALFWDRYKGGRFQPRTFTVTWDELHQPCLGDVDPGLDTPGVGEDCQLVLVPWDERTTLHLLNTDEHILRSHTIFLGPRGGIKVER